MSEFPKRRLRAIHPGEILREEFHQRPYTLAHVLDVSEAHARALLEERAPITRELARRLARQTMTSAVFWTHLQRAHAAAKAEAQRRGVAGPRATMTL
jgi:addiction module HigA family antidote